MVNGNKAFSATIKITIAIIITISIMWIILSRISINDILRATENVSLTAILLSFIIFSTSLALKALRFKFMLKTKAPLHDMFSIVCVHNLTNNLLPMFIGEGAYLYLIKKRYNITLPKGAASLFLVRFLETLVLLILVLVSVLLIGIHHLDQTDIILSILTALIVAAILLLSILIFRWDIVRRLALFTISAIRRIRRTDLITRKLREMVTQIRHMKTNKKLIQTVMLSAAIWILLFLSVFVISKEIIPGITFAHQMLVSSMSVFVNLLPVKGVGGFGSTQAVWAIILVNFGFTEQASIAASIIFHVIFYIFLTILGLYGILMLRLHKKENRPAD
ncbi:flippase-like domain-containing protein [Candidatus Woesearchaeota archaeon]|nr:flippase-like domain-containing protein [Candidatus Woesearchaeota archaeon]